MWRWWRQRVDVEVVEVESCCRDGGGRDYLWRWWRWQKVTVVVVEVESSCGGSDED